MAKKCAEIVYVYGARVLYQHLSDIQAEVEGVKRSDDIESIHRMRVASRRLRSVLKILKKCFSKDDYKACTKGIQAVTRALGQARDIDVQIEILKENLPYYVNPKLKPGIKRLILRLRQKRQAMQAEVVQVMNQLEQDDTLGRIERWAAPWLAKEPGDNQDSAELFQLASSNIRSCFEEMKAYDQQVRIESKVAELHEMRIHAKQLRYTMEAFEEIYGIPISPFINQTKRIQSLLGSIHDADVWLGMIPSFIKEEEQTITNCFGNNRRLRRLLPGLNAFSADRKQSRDEKYQEFIAFWDETLETGVWEELLFLIENSHSFVDDPSLVESS